MKVADATPKIEALVYKHLPNYRVRINPRLWRTLGREWCNLRLIEISEPYIRKNDWPTIKNTVLHEIAHGLAGDTLYIAFNSKEDANTFFTIPQIHEIIDEGSLCGFEKFIDHDTWYFYLTL